MHSLGEFLDLSRCLRQSETMLMGGLSSKSTSKTTQYGKGARFEIEDLRETVPDRDGSGKIKKNANFKKKPAAGENF